MENILFFNKEGYPHNFQFNQDTEGWEGKILFDENSSDTFKTQSLHVFETVPNIEFNTTCDLINLEYHNNSGITITGEVNFENEQITNILKVNESNNFYSKWIYGDNFHKKFPIGTIINFSCVTGSTTYSSDFSNDQYFTVLNINKNAILIITNTPNDIFNFEFVSGYVNSLNVISINDYNRSLSGYSFFQNFYSDKKFSLINSDLNDSVISVNKSGQTYSYLNDLELNGIDGQFFSLNVEFFTEKPKILQGDVTLTENKYLELGKLSYLLEPEIVYNNTGGTEYIKKEIVFQNSYGDVLFSGATFIVNSLIDSLYLSAKTLTFKEYQSTNTHTFAVSTWNTIQYDGYLNIKKGDVIKLSGITSGIALMNNREFSIYNIVYSNSTNQTIIFTPDYIIDETGITYDITLMLQPHQIKKIEVTPSVDSSVFNDILQKDVYCYLTSTKISFTQQYTNNISNTIDNFINRHKSALSNYGIDVYHIIKQNFDYLSVESLYGAKTPYFFVSGYTNGTKIIDDFSLTNSGLTQKYDIIINEKLYNEKTNRGDTLKLYRGLVTSQILLNLKNDTDKFGFKLTLNGNEYFTNYVTTTTGLTNNTHATIERFVDTYDTILSLNGIYVYSGYSFEYTGYTLNITSDVDVWDLEVMVNILSSYEIISQQRNKSILISGNEIRNSSTSFFDMKLATGMIIRISGSSYGENNKEYNIINLTEDSICLSYQGIFIDESNTFIIKSEEFIRKPRGEYSKDIYYRVYWEAPNDNVIDESIFLYDISGDQLIPYNEFLTYIGSKPLISSTDSNIVFLNYSPNIDLTKISNPKYQQTVFDELIFRLTDLDSSEYYNWIPEPLEIYIGYNTPDEGVNTRTLKIEKIEKIKNSDIYFSYSGYTNSGSSISIPNFTFHDNILDYRSYPDFNFLSYGFEKDQFIKFNFKDQSTSNQTIFINTDKYKILDVSRTKLTFDTGYTSGFTYFTTTGRTFYFNIEVQPIEILSCVLYGQTEVEDVRYKVNLNNLGIQLDEESYQVLYNSDIEDNAIDYVLFNRKRKEMLTEFREIFDYIGSYKSLINSINFFGYNDLELYEYYRYIDQSSQLYGKLHKVLIPDIFDNTVDGWNEVDFIAGKYQNSNTWKKTNLFNLAYKVTDYDGNNIMMYSIDTVQYKLTKLKNWLRKNIIPVSANLLDITGVASTSHTLYQNYDESNQIKKSVVERNSTIVNFNYTASLNFGSDYLITINFYILSGDTGASDDIILTEYADIPESFSAKIKTFFLSGDTMIPVQYHKILKNDLTPYSFNLDKNTDPYIYIETTTYDNDGSGVGYVNNKIFYFDEPRNYWLVNHNFDMTKMKYYQTTNYIRQNSQVTKSDIANMSTVVPTQIETNVNVNTLNNTYLSKIK